MRWMLLLGVSLVMSLSLIFVNIPASEAAKSLGNPLTEVSSDKVCGIMLCEESMTIEEKISSFMNQIPLRGNPDQQSTFMMGGVAQQGFGEFDVPPPLKQLKMGILPNEIICKPGLELAFKTSDDSPVCVKPETIRMVDELSWLTR